MIAESVRLHRETYLAILMDREAQGPVLVASPAGGVDIEEVALKSPQLIFKVKIPGKHKCHKVSFTEKEQIDIETGLTRTQAEGVADKLQFKGAYREHVSRNDYLF